LVVFCRSQFHIKRICSIFHFTVVKFCFTLATDTNDVVFAKLKQYIVFRTPQRIAALLLLCFAAQCAWLIDRKPLTTAEQDHIASGMQLLAFGAVPSVFNHTPLVNIAAAVPLRSDTLRNWLLRNAPTSVEIERQRRQMRWFLRAPFLVFGLLLGGSLWYVSRRLYGNEGGYIALALYCFSPALVLRAATINEALPSAWGVFGIIFTGIAISHNLYAPYRKWLYRTVLLGVATGIAVASHPAALLALPLALAFMLYLAPGRRFAVVGVLLSAYVIGMVITMATYQFSIQAIIHGMDLRPWLTWQPQLARAMLLGERAELLERFHPTMILLQAAALLTFFFWKRTRYFGNFAPLLAGAGALAVGFVTPIAPTTVIWALPFFVVFAGGIAADWLESKRRMWAMALLAVLLIENAVACVMMLKQFV